MNLFFSLTIIAFLSFPVLVYAHEVDNYDHSHLPNYTNKPDETGQLVVLKTQINRWSIESLNTVVLEHQKLIDEIYALFNDLKVQVEKLQKEANK